MNEGFEDTAGIMEIEARERKVDSSALSETFTDRGSAHLPLMRFSVLHLQGGHAHQGPGPDHPADRPATQMTMNSQPRPVLFLDFDDVVCLQDPYGGYEAFAAVREIVVHGRPAEEFNALFTKLFNAACVENLRVVHDRFMPRYVLSTSWTRLANRAALVYLIARTPLAFVAEHLHPAWETPKPAGRGSNRRQEIEDWVTANPADAHLWVALDDDRSGAELAEWTSARSAIVLCEEGQGLTRQAAEQLSRALTLRARRPLQP